MNPGTSDAWRVEPLDKREIVAFCCNICGRENAVQRSALTREAPTCAGCESTVRMRGIVATLSIELFGTPLKLDDFPVRKDIRGVGLSDWDRYAEPLSRKLSYKNTFYHQEPLLDITRPRPSDSARYDFLISTDVFEHVEPDVARAFAGAAQILRPGGLFLFSVPYTLEPENLEHFPELHQWETHRILDEWMLINRTREGKLQLHTDLIFHGGPGTTLEMRRFSRDGVIAHLKAAGFTEIVFASEVPEAGVLWLTGLSLPIIARAPARPGFPNNHGVRHWT